MKLKQKSTRILFHIVVLCVIFLLAVTFCEEIQDAKNSLATALVSIGKEPPPEVTPTDLRPVTSTGKEWYADAPLIYHAGGIIENNTYTNAREAVEATLAAGNNFIEIDFEYTADEQLVCVHAWSDVYAHHQPLTLEAFQSTKIQGKFTPMTAQDLIAIMRENPQMYLITDTKCDLSRAIADLTALAGNDPSVLDRFIIQLYQEGQKAQIQQIYPFTDAQFLFTIYSWGPWSLEAARICNDENIAVITVPYDSMPAEDAALLDRLGFTIYEHTVNRIDLAHDALSRGVHSIYTDSLQPEDLFVP